MSIRTPIALSALLLAFAGLGPVPSVQAQQGPGEVRRENQRLQTVVDDLRRDLEAARAEIRQLQSENERLFRELDLARRAGPKTPTPGSAAAPPAAAPVSIDESEADASPRAVLAAVTTSYQETLGDLERGTGPDDPKRVGFLKKLERWANKSNRQFRVPVRWHVHVLDPAVPVGRRYVTRLEAVDPQTGTVLGDPFSAIFSRSLLSRLQQLEQRGGLDDMLVLRGVLTPVVRVNPQRETEGPFNNPPLIGPYAEFEFAVEASTIVPPRKEKEAEAPDASSATTPTEQSAGADPDRE